jgi:hypothetical protein
MKLTDFPHPVPREAYARALEDVLAPLRAEPAVLAVYQIGGIRTPGISDVDLLLVFRDDAACQLNPLAGLADEGRYLFPHSQIGLATRYFPGAIRFGFFHDYKLLFGQEQRAASPGLSATESEWVKHQTGIEYLLKMFISMSVERTYGIVKVRNLLLLGRALRYDLEYVGALDGRVSSLVDQVIAWRDQWFQSRPRDREIGRWFVELHGELEVLLRDLLAAAPMFAPAWANLQIAGNMEIRPAQRLSVDHHGLTLPSMLGGLGRRYFNLQHRFNRFLFHVPITREGPPVLHERHELVAEMRAYNDRLLPHFMPPTSSLDIFRRRVAG